MKRLRYSWPAALILLGGFTLFGWQRGTTRRLARELSARREAIRDLPRLRDENERLRELLAATDPMHATEQLNAEIARLRHEITTLELKRPPALPKARTQPRSPSNESPRESGTEHDAIRIADHKNLGQATPGTAFQTFVWALAHDDLAALIPLLQLSSGGQEQLRNMWQELPAESRARFQQPEQIVMMLLALDVLDEEAIKIVGETPGTSGNLHLRVNRFKHGIMQGEKRIPMRLGPGGWQVVIPDKLIEELPQAIAQASLYVAPPGRD